MPHPYIICQHVFPVRPVLFLTSPLEWLPFLLQKKHRMHLKLPHTKQRQSWPFPRFLPVYPVFLGETMVQPMHLHPVQQFPSLDYESTVQFSHLWSPDMQNRRRIICPTPDDTIPAASPLPASDFLFVYMPVLFDTFLYTGISAGSLPAPAVNVLFL